MGKQDKEFEKFLSSKKAKETWEKGKKEAKSGGFPQYDDGRYKVKFVQGTVAKNQNGQWMVTHEYKFLTGDYRNKPLKKWFNLENENKVKFLIQDLKILGKEDADLDSLPVIHKELNKENPALFINIKTNGEYQNVWLNNLTDEDSEDEEDVEESDDDEDAEEEAEESDDSDDTEEEDSDDDADEDEEEADDEDDSDEEDEDEDSDDEDSDEEADEDEDEDEDSDDDDEEAEDDEDSDEDDEADDAEEEAEETSKKKRGRPTKEQAETENVNIEKGMKIEVEWKKKVVTATVLKVDEKAGKCLVKLKNGDKVKIGPDAIKGLA